MEIPNRFYKYQPYSSYALEGLIMKTIWVSNPDAFNDPFDSKFYVDFRLYDRRIKRFLTQAEQINGRGVLLSILPVWLTIFCEKRRF